MFNTNERIAILGASRGLGLSLTERLLNSSSVQLWLSSRKIEQLADTPTLHGRSDRVRLVTMDFSKSENQRELFESLKVFKPTRIFYCAGGGPFGRFQDKPWHSHLWALNLNLIFPSQLLHTALNEMNSSMADLSQMIFVGSAIAESKADPGAASYAASKHGLKGLICSIVAEIPSESLDIRLYSPGYMNTGMLPPNSRPRQDGSLIADPHKIADDMLHWALTPPNSDHWHQVLNFGEHQPKD